jgi:Nucleotidyl transferase AbiEii toxin, Type IV TA system
VASAESALRTSVADLNAVGVRWALVGGLAVSARTIPRFTKDLDFAIAVASDSEAEEAVHRLGSRYLIPSASSAELDAAREAVKLIQARGFSRGQDVAADLETLIADANR